VKSREVASVSASKLLRNAKVAGRIAELQERLAEKTVINLDGLTNELLDIKTKAVANGSFGPAVAAVVAVAKLHGFMVDKSEVTVLNKPAPLPTKVIELSEDEWLEQFGRQTESHMRNAVKLLNKK
jgi:hypothetical protein